MRVCEMDDERRGSRGVRLIPDLKDFFPVTSSAFQHFPSPYRAGGLFQFLFVLTSFKLLLIVSLLVILETLPFKEGFY